MSFIEMALLDRYIFYELIKNSFEVKPKKYLTLSLCVFEFR